jgi:hypothetical protein
MRVDDPTILKIANLTQDGFVKTSGGDGTLSISDFSGGRQLLQGYKFYHVRTDGNDSNDGSEDDPSHAFLTIQQAVDVATNTLDGAGWAVIINIADGTYTAGATVLDTPGLVFLLFEGNWQRPSNVLIQTDTTALFFRTNRAVTTLDGFKIESANGDGVDIDGGGEVNLTDLDWGACPNGAHVYVHNSGFALQYANWNISGSAQRHIRAEDGGVFKPCEYSWWSYGPMSASYVTTLSSTPNFSIAFADARTGGEIRFLASGGGNDVPGGYISFSGSATGKRFIVQSNSHIDTGGQALDWLPGDIAGELDGTGTYDETVSASLIGSTTAMPPFLMLEPDLPEDPIIIPGSKGATGAAGTGGRTQLSGITTYYVATTGSDSNNGSSGSPWLTIQHALTVAAALDLNGYTLTISVVDGTYATPILVPQFFTNGTVNVIGNTTTPANCIINCSTGHCIYGTGFQIALISFKGFTTISSGGYWHIIADSGCHLEFYNWVFGSSGAGGQIFVARFGQVYLRTNYAITGSGYTHYYCDGAEGIIYCVGFTITVTGTPAFTCFAMNNGGNWNLSSNTYSGAATGQRYQVTQNGVTNCGGSATYFPGNSSGATSTGGQYL